MLNIFKRLIKEEEGQGMVEYGLILALIAVVVIAALTDVGTQVKLIFEKLKEKIVVPSGT